LWGVKNYTPAEVDCLLQTIKHVCPIGNDQWEFVAKLHSMRYAVCGRTADSIKRKFASLASTQPTTGNPTMPRPVLMTKEIREAINKRAGITDVDVSDFFDEGEKFDDDLDDVVEAEDNNLPRQITVVMNEVPVVTQPDQPLNNQQQLVPAAEAQQQLVATTSNRRNSVTSSGPLSTLVSVSVAQTKARTRQNVITSAIETATSTNQNAFSAFLQQKQMSEEYELRQHRLEREEARAHREKELHEMRRKELKQEEQRTMLFQLAITGIMAYFRVKNKRDNEEEGDGKPRGI
jgi:hypothetical protein